MTPVRIDVMRLFRMFSSNWRQFLAIHVAVNVLVFILLAPAATLLLHWVIHLSGKVVLSDEDIVFFIFSPAGIVSTTILLSVFAIIVFLEHAALILAAGLANLHRRVSTRPILRQLARRIPGLFSLAVRIQFRLVLNSLPYLLALALVYWFFLTDYDINYYITIKPPEWRRAVLLGALICLPWGLHLMSLFIDWIFCLPLMLLGAEKSAGALSASRKMAAGQRWRIGAWLLLWLVLSTLAAGVVSVLISGIGSTAIHSSVEAESMNALVLALSMASMAGYVVSFLVAFVGTALLSLLILELFAARCPHAGNSLKTDAGYAGRYSFTLNRYTLAGGLSAGFLAALWIVHGLIGNIMIEDRTEIMAHRGASLVAPENTMAAIRGAIESGAQWVEIDVQETADGEVVVIHDRDLKKIALVPLVVATSTLEQLRQVDIGSWFAAEYSEQRIPTLEEVLTYCRNKIRVNIELKYYGEQQRLEQRVADIVDAAGMAEQVVVMSLSQAGIERMRRLRPDWTLGLLSTVSVGDLAALDVDFLAINARFASRRAIRHIHEQGKYVMVWTVNDPVGMSSMLNRGADVIITDAPALGVELIRQREQLQPPERLLMQLADIFHKPSLYQEQ
jgi:glycerophosphoryl diester phosphodiesterase